MINLLYVLPSHYNATKFINAAMADGACAAYVAEVAKTQTEYHSIVIVNDFLFTTFRIAIANGDIDPANIRLVVASGSSLVTAQEIRCTFNMYGVPKAVDPDDQRDLSFAGTDPLEALLDAVMKRRRGERNKL